MPDTLTQGAAKLGRAVSGLVARTTETILPAETVQNLRTRREWRKWISSIDAASITDLTHASPEAQRSLFKTHVRRVEIETHAKCNRICSFCPNVVMDRRLNKTLMDSQVLDRVFDELGSIDYAGQIVVARYSEPLANLPYLYERLARARAAAPHAQLCITTNTDYLKPSVLDDLHKIGLNIIYMSLYLLDRETWSIELARAYADRLEKKLKLQPLRRVETPTNLLASYRYKGMELRSNCHKWDEYGTDRGGSLDQYKREPRVGPCRDPFETFVIDYNGSVMPCCALRSDLPEHRHLVAGDLSKPNTSIFTIYAGQLSSWRRGLATFGAKSSPCTTCGHRDLPREIAPAISRSLDRQLRKIGPLTAGPAGSNAQASERGPLYNIETSSAPALVERPRELSNPVE